MLHGRRMVHVAWCMSHLASCTLHGAWCMSHGRMVAWSHVACRMPMRAMFKDVECTFGIMKGRFRILKLPFQFNDAAKIDAIFKTCCVLHNMLLFHDGLHLKVHVCVRSLFFRFALPFVRFDVHCT